jgi:hypothetical protein
MLLELGVYRRGSTPLSGLHVKNGKAKDDLLARDGYLSHSGCAISLLIKDPDNVSQYSIADCPCLAAVFSYETAKFLEVPIIWGLWCNGTEK